MNWAVRLERRGGGGEDALEGGGHARVVKERHGDLLHGRPLVERVWIRGERPVLRAQRVDFALDLRANRRRDRLTVDDRRFGAVRRAHGGARRRDVMTSTDRAIGTTREIDENAKARRAAGEARARTAANVVRDDDDAVRDDDAGVGGRARDREGWKLYISSLTLFLIISSTSNLEGHKFFIKIFFPSISDTGSFSKFILTEPIKAKITTNGGEAKKFDLTSGWILPSKFLFPEITLQTFKSLELISSFISSLSGPEFPIQVVQP